MDKKVILILVDGMRPDGFLTCGNPYCEKLMSESEYSMKAQTVFPSVTLPCHLSLFYGVAPDRHGTTTNDFAPQVRPVKGLIEHISEKWGKCAIFYTWEQLRDIVKPGNLNRAEYINQMEVDHPDTLITEKCIDYVKEENPDFTFLYLGFTDEAGHWNGWMSDEYLATVNNALSCIEKVKTLFGEDHDIIVTADHGGHMRGHGSDMPEDMTIPMLFTGPSFRKNVELENLSIMDIAPTVCKILDVDTSPEWEGKSII